MIRYDKWWKMFCKTCKWDFFANNSKCKACGICEECQNATKIHYGCNCLAEVADDEEICPYYDEVENEKDKN